MMLDPQYQRHNNINGGRMVSILSFYSDDPSLINAEFFNFSVKMNEDNQTEAENGPFKNKSNSQSFKFILW